MDEQTQQMIQVLAQVYMQLTGEQDPNKAMQTIMQMVQAAQQGDQQAAQALQQLVLIAQQAAGAQQAAAPEAQQAAMARKGAKLSYIKTLKNGGCPCEKLGCGDKVKKGENGLKSKVNKTVHKVDSVLSNNPNSSSTWKNVKQGAKKIEDTTKETASTIKRGATNVKNGVKKVIKDRQKSARTSPMDYKDMAERARVGKCGLKAKKVKK